MKPGLIGDPDIYLGGKLRKTTLPKGVHAWGISSSKYVQEAVRNMEDFVDKHMPGKRLPARAATPFERDYQPELDMTPELSSKMAGTDWGASVDGRVGQD